MTVKLGCSHLQTQTWSPKGAKNSRAKRLGGLHSLLSHAKVPNAFSFGEPVQATTSPGLSLPQMQDRQALRGPDAIRRDDGVHEVLGIS
jgi:hypothetical protein